jgi:stress response protein SCP2
MEVRRIVKGQNIELPAENQRLHVVLGWADTSAERAIDASALLLRADRRVGSDADFVFYNQPTSVDGSVSLAGRSITEAGVEERIAIDLETVPEDVSTIAIAASLDRGCFGDLDDLRLVALDGNGDQIARYDISDATEESAFVFGEVYRRSGAWKLRAIGQGWASGLAGLATDFGVCVDDEQAEPEPADEAGDEAAEALPADLDLPAVKEPARDGYVEVVTADTVPEQPGGEPQLDTVAVPGAAPAPVRAAGRSTGVRTRKPKKVVSAVVASTLAEDESWQGARLFSVAGIGAADEQEKRATSAMLATMFAVRQFGRGMVTRLGAPAGNVETYIEVPFTLGERTVIPDGVIKVARAGRVWTALLEVKTGTNALRREQVEAYLDVARERGYDAVVTLSNEISPGAGEHPLTVDKRKLKKVALLHMSWAEVVHEARMVLTHRGLTDATQAWILSELIRYLVHPRSGASAFDDMGAAWVPVREAVVAGTLRAGDRKVPAVAEAWLRFMRWLSLRLTADLGVSVAPVMPRRLAADPVARRQNVVAKLATDGTLEAALRIPGTVGAIVITADVRLGQVRTSIEVAAPQEGNGSRRLSWLLRQLGDPAPADLLVEAIFVGRAETACERLSDVRDKPAVLLADRAAEIKAFRLTSTAPLGQKRSGVRGAFVPSVVASVESFYGNVVQGLRPWPSPPPRLPAETVIEAEAVGDAMVEDAASVS